MKINAGEIRVGMLLEFKNDLWQVLKTQHVKPGKGGAFAQVEMKSVNKNTKLNERFRSNETVEKASLEEINFNFLYEDETKYFFMNPKSFEQIEIKKEIVGEKGKLLTENLEVNVLFHNESPISVQLPNQVTCKINSTDVALKGQTVSSSYKPAVLENGFKCDNAEMRNDDGNGTVYYQDFTCNDYSVSGTGFSCDNPVMTDVLYGSDLSSSYIDFTCNDYTITQTGFTCENVVMNPET